MRKFITALLSILIVLACGCSVAETPNDDLNEVDGDLSGDTINEDTPDINVENNVESGMYIDTSAGILLDINSIYGFYEGDLIYSKSASEEFNSADGGSSLINICKYDIDTGESKVLGSAMASYSSGDVAYINGKMYVYEGGSVYDEDSSEWKSEVSLLEIGLTDDSFRVVKSEYLSTSAVPFKTCGDYIISERESEDGISYFCKIDPQAENTEYEYLINVNSDTSVVCKGFVTDAEKIYVLFQQLTEDDTVSHYINIYDINGELLDKKYLSSDMSAFITGTGHFALSAPPHIEMYIFSHYLMISSFNAEGYVLDLNTDNLETVLTTYSPRVSVSSKATDDVYIFSMSLGKVWKYDKESDKIIELNGTFDGITYIRVCDDDIIVHAGFKTYYFPDGSFIVEE